ncbi:reverse transcriptase family protein [Burkholderia cenocepacia]|uniref:RNA-directed DNA polymerase n=1 Tax=Burkholderia cenocepacia TaxID=95486 RepID=A0AAN0RSM8_9BURK|nr:reverse transcriptase family protein [Burkholderia cenocepacia]
MNIISTPLFSRVLENSPFSERELLMLVLTAPERYKDHYIEKRHGRGKRLISQPTAEIKYLQRLIVARELSELPIHPAATAYRVGCSIKDHALLHASNRYLLKLDFTDFFHSIKQDAVLSCLSRDTSYSVNEQWMLVQLLCHRPRGAGDLQLSIGAPSSPFMSNYVMHEFDNKVDRMCRASGAVYSRYADDMAISSSLPRVLDAVEHQIRALLLEMKSPKLRLNESKTVNVSKKNRRTLVGLTLSNEGSVSIGRDEKRRLRAMMHALTEGRLDVTSVSLLRGKLAFAQSIDSVFVSQLCRRHGFSSVKDIRPPISSIG